MKKPIVAVIFGSRSTEHDVSVVTALGSVIKPLELSGKYTVVPVYIAKDGRWFSDQKFKDISLFSSGKLDAFLAKQPPVSVLFDHGLTLVKGAGLRAQKIKIDIAFPATHGTHGEDGELMAVLEMAGVPYVGCDVPASVIAMDKVLAKVVAGAHGILTPKFQSFAKADYESSPETWLKKINDNLQYPLFVKPAHLGSSIGITKVKNKKELANAIEVALHYDNKALVEEAVQNLVEVTLPIMGNEELTPALVEQPLTQPEDFFDFETKYMQGGKKSQGAKGSKQGAQGYSKIPAELRHGQYEQAEVLGAQVYRALGLSGLARIDMLIDENTGKVYFNEVNPLPGSLYAHNWQKAGMSNVELVTKLIALAEERAAKRRALATSFTTNYLQQFK
ncbi:MAG TPA: D-alanine--D-alanine ligase family protein [Candidatus Saccharimonadales bacterium]|nr:D-alanine--D-alanine ligase family protein [Candidatus Saccharimonadales bacterium]